MKIHSITHKYFDYSLKTPFKSAKSVITQRKSIIIRVKTDNGITGYGEASPLYPFGDEKISETKNSAEKIEQVFLNKDISEFHFPFCNLSKYNLSNSIRFALEQCLTEIMLKQNLLSFNPCNVSINGVLSIEDTESIFPKVNLQLADGVKSIKLKLGNNNFSKELMHLKKISDILPSDVKLKLDINGMWKLSEAKNNVKLLSEFNIEYIEQPCKNLNDLIELQNYTSIPLAVDESIRSFSDFEEICISGNINYLILKPTLVGGLCNSFTIIENAKSLNKRIIISSALENIIATNYLLLLASYIPSDSHGLSTIDLVTPLVVPKKFSITNGKIFFDQEILKNNPEFLFND